MEVQIHGNVKTDRRMEGIELLSGFVDGGPEGVSECPWGLETFEIAFMPPAPKGSLAWVGSAACRILAPFTSQSLYSPHVGQQGAEALAAAADEGRAAPTTAPAGDTVRSISSTNGRKFTRAGGAISLRLACVRGVSGSKNCIIK